MAVGYVPIMGADQHHGREVTPVHAEPMSASHLAVAVLVNLMWGLNIIASKIAIDHLQPLTAGALRMTAVLAITFPWLRIMPGRMKWLALVGLLNGLLFIVAINTSLKVADNVGALAVASQLGVPISLILGVILFKERIAITRILAIVIAFAGVAVLGFDPAIAHERVGLLLTILACCFWSLSTLMFRKLIGVPVLTTYAWISAFSALPLLALALVVEPDSVWSTGVISTQALLAILFSALGSTVIGQGGMAWLLQRHPVSTVAPMTLAAPLIATVSSVIWFHTHVTTQMWVGGLMTLVGVAIITIRTARATRH